MELFETEDYREYLKWRLDSNMGRGARSRIAHHIGVQLSFISRVLSGQQHLSPEHCLRAASFLHLSEIDTDYLLLLLNYSRASTDELRSHFLKRIQSAQKRKEQIRFRVKPDRNSVGDMEAMNLYYSSWHHTAVHMYLRNSEYQDTRKIAVALGLSERRVFESVQLLQNLGFIELNPNAMGWKVKDQRFHFSTRSPALRSHHLNWRHAAIRAIDEQNDESIHYSLVLSVDAKSAKVIKKKILDLVEQVHKEIEPAADEEVHAMSLDFFRVKADL